MKFLKYLFLIAVVGVLGYFLVNLITDNMTKDENTDDQESDQEEQTDEDEEADEEESDPNDSEDEDSVVTDFSDYSDEDQSVGELIEDSEYTLTGITKEAMTGFHRFTFVLESDEDTLPLVEASLVSSGGYIRVVLNNVTSDQSGIAYNSYESIDTDGITRLYHDVTAVATEEVYNIGISADTIFHLKEEGMSVVLDVKYPGEVEATANDDPTDFGTADVELGATNTEGDVRIIGYSWGVEDGAVKFIWETSSVSGNSTPKTNVSYDSDSKEITVTFTDLLSDSVLGSSGSFELDLSRSVDQVVGARDVQNDVFVFQLNSDVEYKIYRETSPNQVVIEIR